MRVSSHSMTENEFRFLFRGFCVGFGCFRISTFPGRSVFAYEIYQLCRMSQEIRSTVHAATQTVQRTQKIDLAELRDVVKASDTAYRVGAAEAS